MNDRSYRTATEVATDLGVSLRTVRRWIAEGSLRGGVLEPRWPDTPARLMELRRRGASSMDRLAARGRQGAGPSESADAILNGVRDEFGRLLQRSWNR